MANNVKNRLVIKSRTEEVLDFLRGEPFKDGTPRYIDFNKITPMPEGLNVDKFTDGEAGMEYLNGNTEGIYGDIDKWPEERRKAAIELGKVYINNIKLYGFPTWYEWGWANWGTKCNAYRIELVKPDTLLFETSGNGVTRLLEKLSSMFPDVEFEYTFASEDTGYCVGRGIIKNGTARMEDIAAGSRAAYEITFEMEPDIRCCYELVLGKYLPKREEG